MRAYMFLVHSSHLGNGLLALTRNTSKLTS